MTHRATMLIIIACLLCACTTENPTYFEQFDAPQADAGIPWADTMIPDSGAREDAARLADAAPEAVKPPAILGTMKVRLAFGNTSVKSAGSSALDCACTMAKSKTTGALSLSCLGSTVGKFCSPLSGPGWAIYLPLIKAGTTPMATGHALAKVWGVASAGQDFTGDYALVKPAASAFPSAVQVTLAGDKASVLLQAHLHSITAVATSKAIIVNLDLKGVSVELTP